MKRWQGLVREFETYLPVNDQTPQLTLNEGNTPLIYCANMSEMLGIELYVKYEGRTQQVLLKIEAWLWL